MKLLVLDGSGHGWWLDHVRAQVVLDSWLGSVVGWLNPPVAVETQWDDNPTTSKVIYPQYPRGER